jgi:hypothetical protein
LLGEGDAPEVDAGLRTLGTEKFRFDLVNPRCGKNGLYYWYYTTQAMFQSGGQLWTNWNERFATDLVSNQNVIPKERSEYVDHKGTARAIGYWDQYEGHGNEEGDAFSTVLCALQLEVYYRYLPSFQKAETLTVDEPDDADSDIKIEILI